jgi:DNA-binding transcriptional regulator YiaG
MHAIQNNEISESEMTSLKNKTDSRTESRPPLRVVAIPSGAGMHLMQDTVSVYEQIMDGTLTLEEWHFSGVEKPRDAEKRLLKVISVALDEDDTSVQNEMTLLRNEFAIEEEDRAIWIYFRVLENLWAKLSDDIRSRHFLDKHLQVTEH